VGITSLGATNIDLKYRFTPGIWGRDPSVGAMLAYQTVEYGFRRSGIDYLSTNTLAGAGVFWARSMPKVFDDLFNLIPIFRYPKWVDMEIVLYPVGLDATKDVLLNSAFNFHGKVLWTPRFFGEASFGIKTYNYTDSTIGATGINIALGVAYGTFGIGLNF
jgi:hypothetical protein